MVWPPKEILTSFFAGRSKSGAEHHLWKLLSVADDFHCRPLALKPRERWAVDELKSDAFLSGRGLLTPPMRCRPLHPRGANAEVRFSVSYAWPLPGDVQNSAGRGLPFISRQISSVIAIQAKDAEVPITRFGPFDEFDVDFVRLGFDIDVEDPFVSRFRRFGAKSVSVDEQAGGFQRAGGNGAAVDFQARERPGPFERTKLFHMARQMRPTARIRSFARSLIARRPIGSASPAPARRSCLWPPADDSESSKPLQSRRLRGPKGALSPGAGDGRD